MAGGLVCLTMFYPYSDRWASITMSRIKCIFENHVHLVKILLVEVRILWI